MTVKQNIRNDECQAQSLGGYSVLFDHDHYLAGTSADRMNDPLSGRTPAPFGKSIIGISNSPNHRAMRQDGMVTQTRTEAPSGLPSGRSVTNASVRINNSKLPSRFSRSNNHWYRKLSPPSGSLSSHPRVVPWRTSAA